jgi:hypothetical protein
MGFGNPEYDAYQYLLEESKRYSAQKLIEDEMSKYKIEAIKRFYIITHPSYAEQIATSIAFGYNNEIPEATRIVNKLDLNDKHIAALLDDVDMMNTIVFQEKLEDKMYARQY